MADAQTQDPPRGEPKDAAGGPPPWEEFKDATILDHAPDNIVQAQAEKEVGEFLSKPQLQHTPPPSNTVEGWVVRFTRSLTFNTVDVAAARAIYRRDRDQFDKVGATPKDILRAIRESYAADPSLTAEIAGAIIPAAGIGRLALGTANLATRAAVKEGTTRAATNWAARNPMLARVAAASGAGAGIGAAEEGIRQGIDQALEASAGGEFNTQKVTQGAVTGALVGALATPVANEALRGVAGAFEWVKRALPITDDARTQRATLHIAKALRNDNETLDQTIERVRADVVNFAQEHGRLPALPEIVGEDKTRNMMRVISFYSGLEGPAAELSERQIKAAIAGFDDVVNKGIPLRDTAVVEGEMSDLFSGVMHKYGDRRVALTDEALETLSRNKDFLSRMAKNNADARQIQRVVDSKEKISAFRQKSEELRGAVDVADAKSEVAELRFQISEMITEAKQSGSVGQSEIGRLITIANHLDAAAKNLSADMTLRQKQAALERFKPTLANAERALADFDTAGLSLPLSVANDIRKVASKMVNDLGSDPLARDEARAIRDAIAKVGTKEVPIYGDVVKRWHEVMTASEAQALGRDAIKSGVSTQNLTEYLQRGRLPGGSGRGLPTQVQEGARMGGRVALSRAARQGEAATYRATKKIADSREVQENIRLIDPAGGDELIGSATQTERSIRGMRAAQGRSPAVVDEDMNKARSALTALAAGQGLGGAAKASLAAQIWSRFALPRGVARRVVDIALSPQSPEQLDQMLRYVSSQGIDIKEFLAAITAAIDQPGEGE